ncbi:MAG: hypothetical protein QOC72_2010 [Methylobacteriaceae bacterium]|jgi:hypothetical protein|nr:hypothetical protein [Methylobacteriaceae bacterium]
MPITLAGEHESRLFGRMSERESARAKRFAAEFDQRRGGSRPPADEKAASENALPRRPQI